MSAYNVFIIFCKESVGMIINIVTMLAGFWYFALILAASLIWTGFDIIEGFLGNSDIY